MSSAEIGNNKWELDASRPPVLTPFGMAQIGIIGVFGLFFGWMLLQAVVAIVTPHEKSDLEKRIGGMNEAAPAAAPAETK